MRKCIGLTAKENPAWHFDTGKLKAGDYTIVAFKPSLNVSASHLGVIKRLALPYASGDIRIEDEATSELALSVPDFNAGGCPGIDRREVRHCENVSKRHRRRLRSNLSDQLRIRPIHGCDPHV